MKKILLCLVILLVYENKLFSQSNYAIGFSDGYKAGYCYNSGVGCIPPTVPATPMCKIGESIDSYFDGYNRGILSGANCRNVSKASQKPKIESSTVVYAQPQYIPKTEQFKPNYNFYERALKNNQENHEQNISQNNNQNEIEKKVAAYLKELNAPEKIIKRQEYIKLVNSFYSQLKIYPKTIPDGWHKVVIISEPNPGDDHTSSTIEEDCSVLVQNNKIILVKDPDHLNGGYNLCFDLNEFPEQKEKAFCVKINSTYPIQNGKGEYSFSIYIKGAPNYPASAMQKVYFLDYIQTYQDAQNCITQIKKKYSSLKVFTKVQDGWNIVYAHDGEGFCDIRKVFVEKGKITLYKNGANEDIPIDSTNAISKNKTTISYAFPSPSGKSNNLSIIEIYFL